MIERIESFLRDKTHVFFFVAFAIYAVVIAVEWYGNPAYVLTLSSEMLFHIDPILLHGGCMAVASISFIGYGILYWLRIRPHGISILQIILYLRLPFFTPKDNSLVFAGLLLLNLLIRLVALTLSVIKRTKADNVHQTSRKDGLNS